MLDPFFELMKGKIVPLLKESADRSKTVPDAFLSADYPEAAQAEAARFLAEYEALILTGEYWHSAPIRLRRICTIMMYGSRRIIRNGLILRFFPCCMRRDMLSMNLASGMT